MDREQLEREVKEVIIKSLALENIFPEDIDSAAPLFREGLGLDSIDALELGMALKKKYSLTYPTDNAENRKLFASVSALSDFIMEQRANDHKVI